jgi:hypothetical protein
MKGAREAAGALQRLIFPALVPSKQRLVATLHECVRLVEALSDPVCVALEASGVVNSWREQLATLQKTAGGLRDAMKLAHAIRKMVGK